MSTKDTKSSADNPAGDTNKTELSEKSLLERSQALDEREKALDERAAALDEKEEALNNIGKPAEKIPGLEFTFEKKKYKFSDDAPQKIRLNGEAYTQKEISQDEELLILLMGFGEKYGLISKIK
ncbi:hypothetical protein [Chryseobacterium sp. NFX27]|uniref:hypothetical protein n=1 Tax=Chryseobacterium sp. NFX27 TaxID=2819618 RepID=UPI003CF379FD